MAEATARQLEDGGKLKTEDEIRFMISSIERTIYGRDYPDHVVAASFARLKALKWVLGEVEYL